MTQASIPAHLARPARTHQRRPLRADLAPEPAAQPALYSARNTQRLACSDADNAPPPMRPGAEACLAIPSRMGDRLHYRDGRVTDLQGNAL